MRSGSELRARRRVPWPLGTLPLLQGTLFPAMLPTRGDHATATFACPLVGVFSVIHMMVSLGSDPQGHRYPWEGCWLDLSPCSNSGGGPACYVHVQVDRALCPGSEVIHHLSVAWPCWLGPAVCPTPVLLSTLYSRRGGRPDYGTRKVLHVLDFLPVLCNFVPSGKI